MSGRQCLGGRTRLRPSIKVDQAGPNQRLWIAELHERLGARRYRLLDAFDVADVLQHDFRELGHIMLLLEAASQITRFRYVPARFPTRPAGRQRPELVSPEAAGAEIYVEVREDHRQLVDPRIGTATVDCRMGEHLVDLTLAFAAEGVAGGRKSSRADQAFDLEA